MKTIAPYRIKGGGGKTAACVNLDYLAAKDNRPTSSLILYRKLYRLFDDSGLDRGTLGPLLSMVEY